jgi:hypothetical protein
VEIFDECLGRLRCAIGENVVERSRVCGLEGGCAGGWLMLVDGEWRVGRTGQRKASFDRRGNAGTIYKTKAAVSMLDIKTRLANDRSFEVLLGTL